MGGDIEVKINKEMRDYTESVFFGMNLRQCVCLVLACLVSAAVFMLARPGLGKELASYLCIIACLPFVLVGFVRFNGMNGEQLALAVFRHLITPKHLTVGNTNIFYLMLEEDAEARRIRKKKGGAERENGGKATRHFKKG